MLDLRRLRLLRELKIRGTLAEVAAALSYSPSSVSQQLALLEKEVGVELLRKTGRRVVLTPQAEILVAHTADLLETLERAEAGLAASLTSVTGTVRVAVFQSAALALMPDALTAMTQDYPDVRVEMVQREPETALWETFARDFDLVIAEQYPGHAAPRHPELDHLALTEDAIRLAVPVGPSRYAGIATVAAAADAAWVMEPRGAASRHWAEQACRRAGFEPDVRYETADLQAQIRLIESGNAVALMPDLVWTGRDVPVRLVELEDSPRRAIFTSARRAGAERPAVVAVRKVLDRAAREVRRPEPPA
ncbi:LysR family transcriptional regulator [Arthrobacter agilis]|uniref:LysR family transcriptional regulator n=1 Tax=Arthrobacter agilis TaxID=37921 RepID=UPI000B35ADEF|nr:LysR family transcriptional regulator [Arthrobacter agilis]OUM44244.1 LysR family transcriptional regulator [Arthrobacter agilis]PPB46618.1 LysR family transcriptional regulator [Arthrobacter agilis]TPV23723.1 LysR family transcriptional regulator [Arthrobacter agilis]VDR32449.1 HTH-type transcriptional regulator gltC [Arthrobacter agilis]